MTVASNQRRFAGFTLVEVMIAGILLATALMGFLGSFIQSRRVTEASVMHAAATSLVYGIVEQIKGLDYATLIPNTEVDADAPAASTPPYVRVRINQSYTAWLRVVYTPAPGAPAAPTSTPAVTATAASLGAIDNIITALPLSTASGTRSQPLKMTLWLWIDELPDARYDVKDVKKLTLVYTYTYSNGLNTVTVRDSEVFLRTRFDQ